MMENTNDNANVNENPNAMPEVDFDAFDDEQNELIDFVVSILEPHFSKRPSKPNWRHVKTVLAGDMATMPGLEGLEGDVLDAVVARVIGAWEENNPDEAEKAREAERAAADKEKATFVGRLLDDGRSFVWGNKEAMEKELAREPLDLSGIDVGDAVVAVVLGEMAEARLVKGVVVRHVAEPERIYVTSESQWRAECENKTWVKVLTPRTTLKIDKVGIDTSDDAWKELVAAADAAAAEYEALPDEEAGEEAASKASAVFGELHAEFESRAGALVDSDGIMGDGERKGAIGAVEGVSGAGVEDVEEPAAPARPDSDYIGEYEELPRKLYFHAGIDEFGRKLFSAVPSAFFDRSGRMMEDAVGNADVKRAKYMLEQCPDLAYEKGWTYTFIADADADMVRRYAAAQGWELAENARFAEVAETFWDEKLYR